MNLVVMMRAIGDTRRSVRLAEHDGKSLGTQPEQNGLGVESHPYEKACSGGKDAAGCGAYAARRRSAPGAKMRLQACDGRVEEKRDGRDDEKQCDKVRKSFEHDDLQVMSL